MEKHRFKTIKIKENIIVRKDGIEVTAYTAGVNSGAYGLPYVIEITTWINSWLGQKKYKRRLELNLLQCKDLRDELNEVIKLAEAKKTNN